MPASSVTEAGGGRSRPRTFLLALSLVALLVIVATRVSSSLARPPSAGSGPTAG